MSLLAHANAHLKASSTAKHFLKHTSPITDLPKSLQDQFNELYSGTTEHKRAASVLNSIITQQRIYFSFTFVGLNTLFDSDPNTSKKIKFSPKQNGKIYDELMRMNFFKEVERIQINAKDYRMIFELTHPELLGAVTVKNPYEQLQELRQFILRKKQGNMVGNTEGNMGGNTVLGLVKESVSGRVSVSALEPVKESVQVEAEVLASSTPQAQSTSAFVPTSHSPCSALDNSHISNPPKTIDLFPETKLTSEETGIPSTASLASVLPAKPMLTRADFESIVDENKETPYNIHQSLIQFDIPSDAIGPIAVQLESLLSDEAYRWNIEQLAYSFSEFEKHTPKNHPPVPPPPFHECSDETTDVMQ